MTGVHAVAAHPGAGMVAGLQRFVAYLITDSMA